MAHIYSVYITEKCDVKSLEYDVDDGHSIPTVKDLTNIKYMILEGYKEIQNHKSAIWCFTDRDLAVCFMVACKNNLSLWITEYEIKRYCDCLNRMDAVFGLGG